MLSKKADCLKFKVSDRVVLLPEHDSDISQYSIDDKQHINKYIYKYSNPSTQFQNKIISFPFEIRLSNLKNWSASNCVFSDDVVIVIDDNDINFSLNFTCCIFESNLIIKGDSNEVSPSVLGKIAIDNCSMKRLFIRNIVVIDCFFYKSDLPEVTLEDRKTKVLRSENSNIGIIDIIGCKVEEVSIPSDNLKKYKFISGGIYKNLLKNSMDKGKDKDFLLSKAFDVVSIFLKNRSVSFNEADMSKVFYERAYLQNINNNKILRLFLYMFGYFQNPLIYIGTGLFLWICVALFIWVYACLWAHNNSITPYEAFRLAFGAFFGLSYTVKGSATESLGISYIVSSAIGVGTIFYSSLLVTLLNRFKLNL